MTKAQKAVDFAVKIAKDDSYGYDQQNRQGPDYDCSSLVITSWENAEVQVRKKWCNVYREYEKCLFKIGVHRCN